jgi:hypothetical protein
VSCAVLKPYRKELLASSPRWGRLDPLKAILSKLVPPGPPPDTLGEASHRSAMQRPDPACR